jgi:Secretion system C-terminal sorting domain
MRFSINTILSCLILFSYSLSAQNTWQSWLQVDGSIYNEDIVTSITIDAQNKLIVAGNGGGSSPVWDFDASTNHYLAQLDTSFTIKWAIPAMAYGFGTGGNTPNGKLTTDQQGNIYWVATFWDSVKFDNKVKITGLAPGNQNEKSFYIAKINTSGEILWTNVFSSIATAIPFGITPTIASISTDNKGNLYVGGTFFRTLNSKTTSVSGSGTTNGFIIKLDANTGTVKKMLAIGNSGVCRTTKIKVDSKGNPIITGDFNGSLTLGNQTIESDVGNMYVAKLDSNLNKVWLQKSSGGGCFSMAMDVNEKDNIFIAGQFEKAFSVSSNLSIQSSWKSLFVAHYAPDGTPLRLKGQNEGNSTEIYPRDLIAYKNVLTVTGDFRGDIKMGTRSIVSTTTLDNSIFNLTLDTTFNIKKLNTVGGWGLTRGTALTYVPQSGQFVLAFTFNRFVGINGYTIETSRKDAIIVIDKDIVSKTQEIKLINATVSPNPAKDYFLIDTQDNDLFQLFDNVGKLVQNGFTNTHISTHNLDNGIYHLLIKNKVGDMSHYRLVVAK